MSDWTIEHVAFVDGDDLARKQPAPPRWAQDRRGKMWGRVVGRMSDGRRWYFEMPFTYEAFNDIGAERCEEMLRASARPPAEP